MKPRVLTFVWLLPIVGASGCATGVLDVKPESLGAFECVDRGAVASPPPRSVLGIGSVRGDQKTIVQREGTPLLRLRLCPDGRIPVSKTPAKPTVAKGNPLIGPIDRPVSDFFREGGTGEIVRRSLRPFQKVYYIPPGPDEKKHEPPADPPDCNGIFYYGSCYYYGPASESRAADGGGMTVTIKRPAFHGDGHSLDEISVQGGTDNGNIVELGWNVSTSQYPDADPHLFVYHWINWAGTCYDTCGWHQVSATYFPGMNLAPLVGHDVYNGYVHFEGNWWAWFDNQWLGYFSDSEWSGSYTQSAMIQWFGEIATNNGTPPDVQMGNGFFPANLAAARMATLCDVDAKAWVCWIRDLQSLGPNYPPYYDIGRIGFGETRYGGPGH